MRSAVLLTEAGPRLELAGEEWIYPVTLDQGGIDFKVLFHMKPYSASEMKSILMASTPRWKRINDDRSRLVIGETDSVRKFFDVHFLRMSGIEDTLEQQKNWLAENENIKSAVIANGMAIELVKPESNGQRQLPQLVTNTRSVNLRLHLSPGEDPITGGLSETEIVTVHHFAPISANHYAKYERQAVNLERNEGKKEIVIIENFDIEEKFYDELIERVEGAVINGEPCEAGNKPVWIKLMPFRFKSVAIAEAFNRARIKNV